MAETVDSIVCELVKKPKPPPAEAGQSPIDDTNCDEAPDNG
jgi:hypothetical protein